MATFWSLLRTEFRRNLANADNNNKVDDELIKREQLSQTNTRSTQAKPKQMTDLKTIKPLTTTIVGGGNSAHVLIPLLHEAGHVVNLMTRRPNDWSDTVYCDDTDGITNEVIHTHVGKISKKSSDPAEVIPQADVIVLCMPVSTYRPSLARLAPHIAKDKPVFIGTVFGQAGFNWMVHSEVEKAYKLNNVVTFAIGSIPWICRTIEYGKRGCNYGSKDVNVVAVSPRDQFHKLEDIFLDDISYRPFNRGKFRLSETFLALTLSVDNQIIHPARCYGLWKESGGKWASEKDVPYFYRDFSVDSAKIMEALDNDYTTVRTAIKERFPKKDFTYMLSYLELENLNHKSGKVDILSSLKDSQQLAAIKTPVVPGPDGVTQELNTQCRFFTDDIPYGLLIAKWLAERLEVQVPMVDEVINWAQSLRGEEFLKDGKIHLDFCLKERFTCGIPESYGISKMEDIVE